MEKNKKMLNPEDGYLGYLLRRAAGTYKQKMESALSEYGITAPQFTILTVIASAPGASNADIARVAFLSPQTVNEIISRLEKRTLIQRSPHEFYKKIQKIALTDEGESLLASCSTVVGQLENRLQSGMSESEKATVLKWFEQIMHLPD